MTSRGKVILAVSIGLGLVVLMTMGGILIMRTVTAARKPPDLEARKLLVTAHRLRDMGIAIPDPDCCGQFGQLPGYGTRAVMYSFNTEGKPPAIYLHSQAEEAHKLSAMQSYRVNLLALRASMRAGGQQFVERKDLLDYGDDRYAALIQRKDGATVGNLFAFRKGGTTVMVILVGLYFEDPEEVKELFAPVVETIEARRKK